MSSGLPCTVSVSLHAQALAKHIFTKLQPKLQPLVNVPELLTMLQSLLTQTVGIAPSVDTPLMESGLDSADVRDTDAAYAAACATLVRPPTLYPCRCLLDAVSEACVSSSNMLHTFTSK